MDERIITQARRAAKSALIMWYSGQWQRQAEQVDDLTQELLLWYAETPSTRSKMETLSDPEVMVTFRIHARQILSKETHESNVFMGSNLYSGSAVREALRKGSTNKYLYAVIPIAMEALISSQRSALYNRYELGVVPKENDERNLLKRAVRSLTDEINVIYLTTDSKTIGSKSVIFPESIKQPGMHGDPTGSLGCLLATLPFERRNEADLLLDDADLASSVGGAKVEPVVEFGPSGKFRLSAAEAALFARVPGLIDLFIDQKRDEWA